MNCSFNSILQYRLFWNLSSINTYLVCKQILWPECGWQAVSLTDLITGAAVKKQYRKATLCIHPDKVQQKGANLQQKYTAEKVFDILKVCIVSLHRNKYWNAIWNFNISRRRTIIIAHWQLASNNMLNRVNWFASRNWFNSTLHSNFPTCDASKVVWGLMEWCWSEV